jgi:type II secretory pathway predicted ATPase ExeA
MYVEHFGLERKPFEQTPDSKFLFASEQHGYALASIKFAIANRDAFVIVTGEIGSGKTTLLNKVLSELDDAIAVARVGHTRISDKELLQMILVEFGFTPFGKEKVELITLLRRFVEEQAEKGRQVLILIDEAQNLSADVLEELRLLTCIETEQEKLLNVVLLGQPELSVLLDSPGLEQLRQRCRLRLHIDELTEDETGEYLRHRMAVAGGDFDAVFEDGLDEFIHLYSGGVPRLINTLCDTALTAAAVDNEPRVTLDTLDAVVKELRWSERGHGEEEPEDTGRFGLHATLKLEHRGKPVGEYVLSEAQNIMGRDPDCQLYVDNKFFSRRHAIISREQGGWSITDLNSTNGTKVNGRRISKVMLTDGDVIVVGKHRLTFSAGSSELHAVDWRGGQRSGDDRSVGSESASDSSGITFGPFTEGR